MEPGDTDDFDDPLLAARLRAWGAAVRQATGAPAVSVPDLAAMHAQLDSAAAPPAMPGRRWRPVLAAAAVLLVGLLAVLLQGHRAVLPALPGTAPILRDLVLSSSPELVRGEPSPPPAPERPLYVHFFAAGAGMALVLLLDPQRDATLLTPTPAPLADERLGPFRVPQRGEFVLIVVASATAPSQTQIDRIVTVAADAAKSAAAPTAAALQQAVTTAFAGSTGLGAVCLPFALR